MVKLRLKRMGSKYNAFYRIVAADARAPRDGKYIEELGFYNPHTKEIRINTEIKNKWLKEGAVPSETVKKLFVKYEKLGAKGEVTKLPIKPKKVKVTPVVEVKEEVKTKTEDVASAPTEEAKTEEAKEA